MKFMLALLNGLFIVPAILAAPHARTKRGEKPVGKVDPETASDCTYWEEKTDASVTCDSLQAAWSISANDFVKEGDGCADIITNNGIGMEDFAKWNPRVGPRCTGLWAKTYTCVGILGSQPDKPTAPPNAVKTPSPIQPDMINSCNRFHFVESGQSCQDIASRYGVTVSELTNWNPKAGSDCSHIFGQTWACVDPIRSFSFDDGTKNQWIVAEGGVDTSSKALAMTSFSNKAYYDVQFNDVAFEARITLRAGRSGNAGIMFRASDIGKGGDQYHGYYAGVNLAGDLVLGRVNNDWRELGRAKVGVSADRPFTIKALATGDQIAVYVNNVDRPALTVRDGTFRSGNVGVRTYETEAVFDDVSVSTVVFDDFERNLINWQIYDGGFDARTRELVASDVTSGKIAYQATFEDFVLEADVALTHSGDNRNAGFLFRTTDVGNGPDAYKGYYVGIDTSSRVILGRAGGGWKQLDQNNVGIRVNQKYRLRVRAIGNSINVWVDGNPYIQYLDSTYKKGMAGVRVYSTGAVVDNFTIQKI